MMCVVDVGQSIGAVEGSANELTHNSVSDCRIACSSQPHLDVADTLELWQRLGVCRHEEQVCVDKILRLGLQHLGEG